MERTFEQQLATPFAVFVRAYLRKYPSTWLKVLDAETCGAELRGADVLVLHRRKSLMQRKHWAEETFVLDRAAQTFLLQERELAGTGREEVRFADGLYSKRAHVNCGEWAYNALSKMGLLHLNRLIRQVEAEAEQVTRPG